MTILSEGRHAAEFILSEANSFRSRETIVIDSSQTLLAGALVAKVSEGAKTAVGAAGVPAPAAATITASPTAALNTKVGVHQFQCIVGGAGAASKWEHTDPDGLEVGIATGATAYAGGGLSGITIADPGTDPTPGETLIVTVSSDAASGRYVKHDPEGINGSQGDLDEDEPLALILTDVTTGVGETAKVVGIKREAEVKLALIVFDDHDTTEKAAAVVALARQGISARS